MKHPRPLKYAGTCGECGYELAAGRNAHFEKGRGVRCLACGPHATVERHVTVLDQAPWRSQSNRVMTRSDVRALGITKKQRHRNRKATPS